MNKTLFVRVIKLMRESCLWIDKLDKLGIDLGSYYFDSATEAMYLSLTNGQSNWDYDPKENFSWILEFTGNENFFIKYASYERAGRIWNLGQPEVLYDFITYMNENGWNAV